MFGFGAPGLHGVELGEVFGVGGVGDVVVDHGVHLVAGVLGGDEGVDDAVVVPYAREQRGALAAVGVARGLRLSLGKLLDEIVDCPAALTDVQLRDDPCGFLLGIMPDHCLIRFRGVCL